MKFLLGHTCVMFLLSGLVKITAGVVILAWPLATFTPLIYLFGIPAVVQGVIYIYAAAQSRMMYDWWWALLMVGIVYLAAGFFVLSFPDLTSPVLFAFVAGTWAFAGLMMVLFSVQLNREGENGLGLLLAGVFSLSAGIYLLSHLHETIYSVQWAVAAYGLLTGTLILLFGVKAKSWHHMYFDDIME